jgi:hypothetical protein
VSSSTLSSSRSAPYSPPRLAWGIAFTSHQLCMAPRRDPRCSYA